MRELGLGLGFDDEGEGEETAIGGPCMEWSEVIRAFSQEESEED